VEVYLQTFLTSALDEGQGSASRVGRFTPGERATDAHWIGGWVCHQAMQNLIHSVITNDVSDYINLFVRIAHIIYNHTFYYRINVYCFYVL